jgi:hypothetical protein
MVEQARVACPDYRSAVSVESRWAVGCGGWCARREAGRPHADFRLGRLGAAVKTRRHRPLVTGALGQGRPAMSSFSSTFDRAGGSRIIYGKAKDE